MAFSEFLAEFGICLNGLWQTVFFLSWSYYLYALCPGTVPSAVFSWEQEDHVSRVFWKDYQSWIQRIYTFVVSDVCFPPNVLVWKTCRLTYIFSWYFQIYVSDNDHFPVMKLIRELSGSWASSLQRQLQVKQEIQYFLVFAHGAKTAFPRLL